MKKIFALSFLLGGVIFLTGCEKQSERDQIKKEDLAIQAPDDKKYSTLKEYNSSIDYSCKVDADCEIKDIRNCCGRYPKCVNSNTKVDPDFVKSACEKEEVSGICGFDEINSCQCVSGMCQEYQKE